MLQASYKHKLFRLLKAQIISCMAFFFFFEVPGRLLLLGLLEGTAAESIGTSSMRHESLKLIKVVIGMFSYLMSLSLRIAWMACCTLADGIPS